MRHTSAVVVGAGHCGLAMSRCLAARSVDHVVLERGDVAHSWRTRRWDSLRLLTPNWMTRLPGYAYRGDDPDGYLGAAEVAGLLEDYAAESAAP
ncbi:MAG TPA: FAD-dependent oxidoreductase, partial [Pseudonocardia sp.]|nr:FAD-dependent oxidoreductase [Pseudonocardia sp.]